MLGGCASVDKVDDVRFPPKTFYRYSMVKGKKIFYREAGDPARPTLVLLHGYPSSSHTYRELIPLLSPHYHVIAPDYLGSGHSDKPNPKEFKYTFEVLTDYVEGLLANLGLKKYVLYLQDFGAPVGFRLMMRQPDKIAGFVAQNANAYLDGLTEKRREFFLSANKNNTPKQLETLLKWIDTAAIINGQYLRDVPKEKWETMSPDAWTMDLNFLRNVEEKSIQVQLFQDYQNNINSYPKWQSFLRERSYPAVILWGKHDAAFIVAGAEAYLRDLPKAKLHLLDAGHFAVEEKSAEIAKYVLEFMRSDGE